MTLIPQNLFNGGISEDDRIAWANQYVYWENIDVISEPDFMQISKGVETTTTLASTPYNMVAVKANDISGTRRIIVLCNDEIYHEGNNTPVYTDSSMNRLEYPAFVQGDYFYWVQSNWPTSAFTLNRTTLVDAVSTSWSPTMSYATLITNNYFRNTSHLSVWNETYISLWSNIEYLKYDGTTELFDTLVSDEIVGMADTYSGIFIFTENGKAILWDWVTNIIKSSVNLEVKLTGVYQYWTQIFLISWGFNQEKGLYQFDGSSAIRLFREKFSRQVWEWRLSPEWVSMMITNNGDNFYFVDAKEIGDRVLFYWNEVTWTQKGLHYLNTNKSDGTSYSSVRSILFFESDLYIAWSGWGYWVDKVTTNCQSTGFLITNTRDYGTGILLKDNLGLYFRVRDVDATHTIEVQATYDDNARGTYTSIYTVDEMPENGIVRIPKQTFVDAGLNGEFEDISFKFILTTDDTTSPKIYKGITHDVKVTSIIWN